MQPFRLPEPPVTSWTLDVPFTRQVSSEEPVVPEHFVTHVARGWFRTSPLARHDVALQRIDPCELFVTFLARCQRGSSAVPFVTTQALFR